MKAAKYSFLLAAALAVAGCSSVRTQVDTGPIVARTFSFMNTGPKQAPAFADNRAQVHGMIQQAVVSNLARRGVTSVPSGGDVTVAYLVVAGNNASTTSLNEWHGACARTTRHHVGRQLHGHVRRLASSPAS